jgi:phage baseplate assembly protein W
MASGTLVVLEAILRRWTTPRGGLIDDPNYGWNVFDLVSDDLGPRDLRIAQQQLAAEATKDERVRRAAVTVTIDVAGLVRIDATITTAEGPFRFVLGVSAVTPLTLLVSP